MAPEIDSTKPERANRTIEPHELHGGHSDIWFASFPYVLTEKQTEKPTGPSEQPCISSTNSPTSTSRGLPGYAAQSGITTTTPPSSPTSSNSAANPSPPTAPKSTLSSSRSKALWRCTARTPTSRKPAPRAAFTTARCCGRRSSRRGLRMMRRFRMHTEGRIWASCGRSLG